MNTIWMWVVAVVVIIGGFIWWQSAQAPAVGQGAPTTQTTPSSTQDTSGIQASTTDGVSAGTVPVSATVTYTDSGFSPSTVTIALGGMVTFIDQSGGGMWVASNPHPAHSGYDGTSRSTHCAAGYTGAKPFDECAKASSFSFTFTKAGSWGYHNHIVDGDSGTVIVQ